MIRNEDKANNGSNLQKSVEHGVDRATSAAHHNIDSISDAAQPTINHLRSGAHKAVDSAGDAASQAASALVDKGEQLQDKGKQALAHTNGYVREHPVASLGMAVAAGFLLSRLMSGR